MKSYRQLTQEERYSITALRMAGSSQAEIGRPLGRHPSTIGREVRRNKTTHDGGYRRRLSAEQVSGVLKKDGVLSISTETIYRRIRWDKKTGGDLWRTTRIMSKFGRKRYGSHDSRGVMPGKRHISERPAEVEQRLQFGHWEGDTVMGCDLRHCVLTLVGRKTGFAIIKKLETRTTAEVTRAATPAIAEHASRFATLTFDNGTEFHAFAKLEGKRAAKSACLLTLSDGSTHRLPSMGQQLADIPVALRRQPGQHVLEVGVRVVPVELG